MKHDEIVDGEALPSESPICPTAQLVNAMGEFINTCHAAPPKGLGARHIGEFIKVTMAKVRLRRALNTFCDQNGVDRI